MAINRINMRNIVIFMGLIALSVLSGCASIKVKARHSTPAQQQQQSSRQYSLTSFVCDHPLLNVLTLQEINRNLTTMYPERFSASGGNAMPVIVTASLADGEVIKRARIFSLGTLPYFLTLGILPGYIKAHVNPVVKILFPDNTGSFEEVDGYVEYVEVAGISVMSPFGFIPGNYKKDFRGDAQAKGSYIMVPGKKIANRIREVYLTAIAIEINGILDKYEATQPVHPGLSSNNVSNIRVQQHDEALIIMYDLSERSNIEVHVSVDGGVTFRGPVVHVMGAVGRNIAPERDKVIVWDVGSEFGTVDYENTVVKIVSTVPN